MQKMLQSVIRHVLVTNKVRNPTFLFEPSLAFMDQKLPFWQPGSIFFSFYARLLMSNKFNTIFMFEQSL